ASSNDEWKWRAAGERPDSQPTLPPPQSPTRSPQSLRPCSAAPLSSTAAANKQRWYHQSPPPTYRAAHAAHARAAPDRPRPPENPLLQKSPSGACDLPETGRQNDS